MAEFKVVISDPKTGKSYQREVKEEDASHFLGRKIGHEINGEIIGLIGYKFAITGGSDFCGFPMRRDVPGMGRKKVFSTKGIGIQAELEKGKMVRKTVCGNTIHEKIAQLNLKILEYGKAPLGGPKAEEGKAEAAKPAEAKEAPKKEEKPEAKEAKPKEAKPKEEKQKEKKQ